VTKLNKTDFNLRVRRGTRANVYLVANYPLQGELGYTTDDKHLYVGNASNIFEPLKTLDMALTCEGEVLTHLGNIVWRD
jgi:hypothetical protein